MDTEITIIIADDHPKFWAHVVNSFAGTHVRVIGEASNGIETLRLCEKKFPDIILLDLNMPVMDGEETFTKLFHIYHKPKIIILSFYRDKLLIDDYIVRGAAGFISKDSAFDLILLDAVIEVMLGNTYIVRSDKKEGIGEFSLSKKQTEIMPLLCEGYTNKEIAEVKGISERAVEKRRKIIYLRMHIKNSCDFFKIVFNAGLQFLGKRKPKGE